MHKYFIPILFFTFVLSFQIKANTTLCFNKKQSYSVKDFSLFCDTNSHTTLKNVIEAYNQGKFTKISHDNTKLSHHTNYWIRFDVKNNLPAELTWMLEFNTQISHVWIYCLDGSGKLLGEPIKSVAINNISRNKVLLSFPHQETTTVYIKINNQILLDVNISNMQFSPISKYERKLSMHGFLVGGTFGGYIIMFIISLQIFFAFRRKEYIYYSLYIVFNGIFALFGSFLTDKYLFYDDPWKAFNLHGVILLAHLFYIIFVRYFIAPSNIPPKTDRYIFKPIMWFIYIVNPVICIISFYDIHLFKQLFDIVILTEAVLGLVLSIVLLQIKLRPVRLILVGSLIMIVFGIFGQLADAYDMVKENYFYNIGVLLELILFSYAITYKQKQLQEDKKEKEKHMAVLKAELAGKNRELTQKAINITQKEQMLTSLNEKLQSINTESIENRNIIQGILLDIDIYRSQHSWIDFENYFTKVHPKFFVQLKQYYPELTSNEIRLCALLRLTLNTKEIASITGKTPKSIDVMRNRIRNKIGLERSERLYDILSNY